MDGSSIARQLDEWHQQAAKRLRAYKAAGLTDDALAAIYTPEVCAEWDCNTPAEALSVDYEILADAWLWENPDE